MRREINGSRFYSSVAEWSADEAIADGFKKLAVMELDHAMRIKALGEKYSQGGKSGDEKASNCLKAMASAYFSDPREEFRAPGGQLRFEDVLRTAIVAEKDAIAFYTGLKAVVHDESGKRTIEEIIAEEMEHIVWLNGIFEDQIAGKDDRE